MPPRPDLGRGSVVGHVVRLGLPASAALLAVALYAAADTFWVTRLGPGAVAGLTLVFPLQLVVTGLGSGLGLGLASAFARRRGAADLPGEGQVARLVLPLTAVLGLAVLMVARLAPTALLDLCGATDSTRPDALAYLSWIAPGLPALLFSMFASNLLRGAGDTLTPMWPMVGGAFLNVLADPLFIFGAGPLPALGVAGAGLATCLSQWLSALALLLLMARPGAGVHPYRFLPGEGSPTGITGPALRETLTVGLPAAASVMGLTAVVAFHVHVLAPAGAASVGAYGLLVRAYALVVMPTWGLCQGLLPVVGHAWGAASPGRARSAVWSSTLLAGAAGLAAGLVVATTAPVMVVLLGAPPDLAAPSARALALAALGWPAATSGLVLLTALQALGRGGLSMVVLTVRTLVLTVPLLLILSAKLGPLGVWFAQPLIEWGSLAVAAPLTLRALASTPRAAD